jgi:TPR repeat protein
MLRLQPTAIEVRQKLAMLLYQIGDMDGAMDEYRAILAVQPGLSEARVQLAAVMMAKQDWRSAKTELEEAVRTQPDLVQAHTSLGTVRYTLGDVPGAIQAYRLALQLAPDFADAHYHLGLLLKVSKQEAEAVREWRQAAEQGLSRAQYFVGTAYVQGHGVRKDPAEGILWWLRASEQGLIQGTEALIQWRQVALGTIKRTPEERRAALQALQDVRLRLRQEVPGLEESQPGEGVGTTLLNQGRTQEAVVMLLREAAVLSEPAQKALERLYMDGVEGQLAPYDERILRYFIDSAAEGLPEARLVLARIYANGLGVSKDRNKALALLKGHPQEEGRRLFADLSAQRENHEKPQRGGPRDAH